MTTVLGVISDTHGLLRPEAVAALEGCDAILHAGDVGKPEILEALSRVAPVTAIRGNVDHWARDLPDTEVVEVEGRSLYMLHDLNALDLVPRSAGFDAVVSGHSHRPSIEEKGSVLYLNPGSAGPRRFTLPISVALLTVSDEGLSARIVEL